MSCLFGLCEGKGAQNEGALCEVTYHPACSYWVVCILNAQKTIASSSVHMVTWFNKCPLLSKYILSIVQSVHKMANSTVISEIQNLELVDVQYIKIYYRQSQW